MNMNPDGTLFDTLKFIGEVRQRPAIWDLACNDHASLETRRTAWENLITAMYPSIDDQQYKDTEKMLQRRWKSLRDCYTREVKRLKNGGSARKNAYVYFQQLSFLSGMKTDPDLEESQDMKSGWQMDNSDSFDLAVPQVQLEVDEPAPSMAEDEDRLFLLSLLGPLKRVPYERRLQAKIEMMKVLQKSLEHNEPPPKRQCLDEESST